MRSRRHSGDDALLRWYMAERGLEALEPRDEAVVRHVDGCTQCATRYATLCLDLDGAARTSRDAADAAFSTERLALQHERILRRVDNQGAKVLTFPTAEASVRGTSSSRSMLRWVAVAAAAGLFIGLAAGRLLYVGGPEDGSTSSRQAQTVGAAPAVGLRQVRSATLTRSVGEDVFMSEVDMALSAPRTSELDAIDAMTLRFEGQPPRR